MTYEATKEALYRAGAHDRAPRKSFDAIFNGDNTRGYFVDREGVRTLMAAKGPSPGS